jgi:hypothetical protein
MLMNTTREKARDTDVERAGLAGQNVNPNLYGIRRASAAEHSTAAWEEHLVSASQVETSWGSLYSSSASRFAGSFLVRRDDSLLVA